MPGPIWLRWVLTVTGILLAGSRLAGLIGLRLAARTAPASARPAEKIAPAGVAMPLSMAAMFSPVGNPAPMRDAALGLGALTAGFGIAALWQGSRAAPLATTVDFDYWLNLELSSAAMVLAIVASHGAGAPVELAAMVPPLTYHFVRHVARSVRRALAGPALPDGGDLAASAAMIYMLLTMP
jgi:hypothetical protein